MDLTEANFDGARPFQGYGPGFFRIGNEVVEGAVVLHPDGMHRWEGLRDAEALTRLAGQIDVVFVGTGAEIAHIPADLRVACEEAGLGVEAMSSPAACRTYNVLLSEGRRVAAAVLPVD